MARQSYARHMACHTWLIAIAMADEVRRGYAREKEEVQQRLTDKGERGARSSALKGHVDYVDLAERVGQGVSVEPPRKPGRQRRSRNRSIPDTGR